MMLSKKIWEKKKHGQTKEIEQLIDNDHYHHLPKIKWRKWNQGSLTRQWTNIGRCHPPLNLNPKVHRIKSDVGSSENI